MCCQKVISGTMSNIDRSYKKIDLNNVHVYVFFIFSSFALLLSCYAVFFS